jgi:hypothetical protein
VAQVRLDTAIREDHAAASGQQRTGMDNIKEKLICLIYVMNAKPWHGCIPKQTALDKKAENARELGLDYEPVLKDNSNYRLDPPVAEPVEFLVDGDLYYPEEIDCESLQEQGHTVASLYTNPPAAQRQWVGLTDEEVGDLSDFAYANDEEFVRNVEAKLKERNV